MQRGRLFLVVSMASVIACGGHAWAQTVVFSDGFETGDSCTWSTVLTPEICDGIDNNCDLLIDDGDLCNDGVACTTDECQGVLGCSSFVNAGYCLIDGICFSDGAGNPVNQCQRCVAAASQSAWSSKPDGSVCTDGDLCTDNQCIGGQCASTPATCNDSNLCTIDACGPGIGCVYTPATCNDSNLCTIDACAPGIGCVYTPVTCDDSNPCTADACDPVLSCVYTALTGMACDDGDPETVDDRCTAGGQCVGDPA